MANMYPINFVTVTLFCSFSLIVPLYGGQIETKPEGTTVWQAGIDGPRVEWGPDGSWNRIYSRYSQPVAFPDRQGISKAQIIAEEKAKGEIVRFINQEVASARVVTEIQNDMNQSTRTKWTAQEDNITKTSQRQMIETLSEITSSVAAGRLRGVVVLERGYDAKEEVAWVEVGISQKTMRASESLNGAINGKMAPTGPSSQPGTPPNTRGAIRPPESEVQQSPQKKDF